MIGFADSCQKSGQFFSLTLKQKASDLGNVTEVKESSPRNLFINMREN